MTREICLLASDYAFALPLHSGIVAAAQRVGPWRIESHRLNASNVEGFIASPYDGFIAVFQNNAWVRRLARAGRPIVVAGLHCPDVASVFDDDPAIGALGAGHLAECGYERFGFYGADADYSLARYDGFARAAAKHKIPVTTNQDAADGETWPGWTAAAAPAAIDAWLDRLATPMAVMGCDDYFASRLARRAVERGLRVPGDLAILGVNNDDLLCETGAVPLSSVDTDLERIGFEAGLLLDRLIRGEKIGPRTVRISPRLVVRRQSTSLSAHHDRDIAAAIRYIHEHACDDIHVNDVCRHLAISRRSFEHRFRQAVGHSPGDEIRRLRMERAMSLLRDTTMNIAEISVRCGYGHSASFASAFHREVGVTPMQYRRQQTLGPGPERAA